MGKLPTVTGRALKQRGVTAVGAEEILLALDATVKHLCAKCEVSSAERYWVRIVLARVSSVKDRNVTVIRDSTHYRTWRSNSCSSLKVMSRYYQKMHCEKGSGDW